MERKLSPTSKKELCSLRDKLRANPDELKFSLRKNARGRLVPDRRPVYPPQKIDFFPEPVAFGYMPDEDEREAVREERWAEGIISDLHRDESESKTLAVWNAEDDEQELFMLLQERGELGLWDAALTALRREKLHRLCIKVYGKNYTERKVTTDWQKIRGQFVPLRQVPVVEWIAEMEAKHFSKADGYMAAIKTLRFKLNRQSREAAKHRVAQAQPDEKRD